MENKICVKHLNLLVTQEILFNGFQAFGVVQRAVVEKDRLGKPTGRGFVQFSTSSAAKLAIKSCTEKCFLLNSQQPCTVERFKETEIISFIGSVSIILKKSYKFLSIYE